MQVIKQSELFSRFLEHTPQRIAMFDRQMRYLFASKRWLSDYGLEEKVAIATKHEEIFSDLSQEWQTGSDRCLSGKASESDLDKLTLPDGREIWHRWEMQPWRDENGEIGGAIAIAYPTTPPTNPQITLEGVHIEWHPQQGLLLENKSILMMWINSTLARLMAGMQAMVGTERFSLALQDRGRNSIADDWQIISQYDRFAEGFAALSAMAKVAGWGKWQLHELNWERQECRFRVKNSWEGRYQKALGVCWGSAMLAGKFAGLSSRLFETNCWATQTKFIAKGDEFDEFLVQPSSQTVEEEIDRLLLTDEATNADLAVALQKLQTEINKRKQAQTELDNLFNLSWDLLGIAGFDGYFKQVNPAFEKILGFSTKELLAKPFCSFVHPEDVESTVAEVEKLTTGGITIGFENRYRCQDGSYKWLAWSAVPADGCLHVVARDITENKQVQTQLQQYQEKLEKLVEERTAQLSAEISDRQKTFQELKKSQKRLQLINSISTGINVEMSVEEVIARTLQLVSESFPQIKVAYSTVDKQGNLKVIRSVEPPGIPASRGLEINLNSAPEYLNSLRNQKSIAIADVTTDTRIAPLAATILAGNTRALLNVSLPHSQNLLGLLGFDSPVARKWSQNEIATLTEVAEYLSILLKERLAREQRQQAQTALHESEIRFQRVVANIPGIIYQFCLSSDNSQKFTYVSSGCRELYEVNSEEIQENPALMYEIVHPDDLPGVKNSIAISGETLQPWNHEYRVITPSGKIKWSQARSRPTKQANGDIVWDGFIFDISDRILAEQQRDNFFYLSIEMLAIANRDGYFTQLNPAWENTLGWTREQLTAKPFLDFIHPEDRETSLRETMKVLGGNRTISFENRYLCQDGSYKWLAWNSTFSVEQQMFYTVARDISDRKAAEAALIESEAKYRALAEREALINRLANLIRLSLDLETILATTVMEVRNLLQCDRCMFAWYKNEANLPVWEIIKEAKNPELATMLGIYPASLPDSTEIDPITEKLLCAEVLRVDDVSQYPHFIFQKTPEDCDSKALLILPVRTLNGEIGALSCIHSTKERAWQDCEVELLEIVVDQLAIALNQAELYQQTQQAAETAQKQAQELQFTLTQLQRTQLQLIQSEKMSSLGQMVAGIAHEINNPVNFIHGNLIHAEEYTQDLLSLLELYEQEYPEPSSEIADEIEAIDLEFLLKDLPKLISSMKVGSERIREIVKSLRVFSRLDEAEMKSVNIHECIDSTLMILHNRLKAKSDSPGIEVIKDYGNLPLVECFPGQLNQVLMNIIANAIDSLEDYNHKRSLEEIEANPSQIRITTEILNNSEIKIAIADNGQGMNETTRKRLFDPFFTTKPVGKGTGLGLSISYSIITKQHGGTLECYSTPGQGAEFVIQIPLHQPEFRNANLNCL
ncbi:PAS domain-containing protein [Oscillatoria salina]|uniref:PAS domain-containing protein n=1 Tax=Oscillatoria salina TaxID=331517 RepID=UPI0013B725A0|nr:PAS domain-containing protein [Oscillatoria salina]MBZ8179828.1 PAS domain-containing protein [Oscillatoria salina IIICB1]NET88101.1 PAS domain-containing protein [Kamptonema sp. SIO1D9]